MAKDKKSILVYADWISIFEKLEDVEAGKLIKHFFRYVNDMNPESPDRLTDIIFEPIKQQLKRDLKKYEAICLRNRDNGGKGGRPKQNPVEPKKPTGLSGNPKNPDEPDTDNDTDNDNEKDINSPTKVELPKKYDYIDRIINCFAEEYQHERDQEYQIITRGKDRAAAAKILTQFKKRFPIMDGEQILLQMRNYFTMCINISDTWLWENMSPMLIVSKFNQINTILRNGNNKKNNGATSAELIDLFREKGLIDN